MPDVLQRAEDPRVAPRGILLGHAHHQTSDLCQHRTTASLFLGTSSWAQSAADASGESCRAWRSWRRHAGGDGPADVRASPTAGVLHRSSGSGRARAHAGCGSPRSGRPWRPAAAGRASRPALPGAYGGTMCARRESLYHRPDLKAPKTVGRAMRHDATKLDGDPRAKAA
jgi:hypothetical protein